jgi:hypothetical protein
MLTFIHRIAFFMVFVSASALAIAAPLPDTTTPTASATRADTPVTAMKSPTAIHKTLAEQQGLFYRFEPKYPEFVVQIGAFTATQGKAQPIGFAGITDNDFGVSQSQGQNALVGLGYYVNGYEGNAFDLSFGVNAFYLAPTVIKGTINEGNIPLNLTYQYNLTNYPLYAMLKGFLYTSHKYWLTADVGVGPNIITASSYSESAVDPTAIPNNGFSSNTSIVWSGTFGLGLRINNVIGTFPLEIDYRFFYLGEGSLQKNSPFNDNLVTGDNTANALVLSTAF